MSDVEKTEAQSQLEAVQALDIGQLRRAAKLLGITAERTWTKENFVAAIQNKQANEELVNAVFDLNIGPAAGYARVIIHRDPSPNHKNSPVHLGVNGRLIAMPRGAEFDIPIPFVEALKNATSLVTESAAESSKENPGGVYKEQERMSYPFQVISVTPGPFINTNDGRGAKYAKRKAFFDMYGNWPTDGELKEYNKHEMNQRFNNQPK